MLEGDQCKYCMAHVVLWSVLVDEPERVRGCVLLHALAGERKDRQVAGIELFIQSRRVQNTQLR